MAKNEKDKKNKKPKKRSNCCLTCSFVLFGLMITFVLSLYIGGTILFKSYVSPHIGGLSLNEVLSLSGDVFAGKEAKKTYSSSDLDSFYSGLSSALFLSDKSEDELEYELVSDETRATLAPALSAATSDTSSASTPAYDEDAAFAAFCLKSPSQRYALLSSSVTSKLSLAEYSALSTNAAARKKVGLKTYRLSLQSLMGDMDFNAKDFSMKDALNDSLSSLEFNFDSLENYDIDNAAAAQNEKFTTFSVTGKQASAFIDDIMTYMLTDSGSPIRSYMKEYVPSDMDLTDFVTVSSVTIMNTPLATVGDAAAYNQKDTALGITVSIRLRDLVREALKTNKMKENLGDIPSFATNLIPSFVPHCFSASLTVYPLAEKNVREVEVHINGSSDKNAKNLAKLMNALFPSDDGKTTFFGEFNNYVVSSFSSVNKTVKINFVPSKDKNGKPLKDSSGKVRSEMKIMTWETFLSLIDDSGTISPHDIFTMLKCLYITENAPAELSLSAAKTAFNADLSSKYGVSSTYLDTHNLLSSSDLSDLMDNISLSTMDFTRSNSAMKVQMSSEAIASFITDLIKNGEESSSSSDSSDLLKDLDPQVCEVKISLVSEQGGVKVYSFELLVSVSLYDMMEKKFASDDGTAATMVRKILPRDRSYFGIMLYLSESTDAETGKVVHKVGKNIDNPAEGVASLYSSKIKINDFSYAQTDTVLDTLDRVMTNLASSESFDVDSITSEVEKYISDALNTISNNEFNLEINIYPSDGANGRGGITLPSIYEALCGYVKPKLKENETFTVEDAQRVFASIYRTDLDLTKRFVGNESAALLDEINDKFYLTKEGSLGVDNLFGDAASSLSSKIGASSIYFKENSTEAAKWTGTKRALYSDDRSVSELRVSLTGSRLAALALESNLIPDDLASSFGTVEVLGASFETENGKTYLNFTFKISSGESSEIKYANILPGAIKLTARVLMNAPSYSEEPRFSATLKINDDSASSDKLFILLGALGNDSLSASSLTDTISQNIATTFNTLEGTVTLYYPDGSSDYTFTENDKQETCIKITDIFSFLVNAVSMKDGTGESATDTSAADLAMRMRAFGQQTVGDADNESDYSWIDGLKTFALTDDAYIYENMQRAYFLNDTPTMSDIYGGFSGKFATITTDNFNLSGVNGLFYYDGDIKTLKVSDKALAVIVKNKQSFSSAVQGSGMTADIVSLKISEENNHLVIETGIKIAFSGAGTKDHMMPDYFVIKAKTVSDGMGGYTTTLTMNNLSLEETDALFANILSLGDKGMETGSFNKNDIASTITSAISSALSSFPNVSFGTFSAADITSEYNADNYSSISVEEGDGYLSFPSVYSYLRDLLYTTDKPSEAQLQSMIVALHDPDVASEIVTNGKSSSAYHVDMAFKGNNAINDYVLIYSDKYLAHKISDKLASSPQTVNDNITVNGIDQTIVLRALGSSEEQGARATWKSKFFSGTDNFVRTDNYMIVTVTVSLSGYSSGDSAKVSSILPNDLVLTVLVDYDTPANSKGLLYNMSQDDMYYFEKIMQANNTKFTIDDIAVELAGIIKSTMNNVKSIAIGAPIYDTVNFDLNFRLNTDEFLYSTSLPYEPSTAYNVTAEWNYKEEDEALDDEIEDGIGYVILSRGAIS